MSQKYNLDDFKKELNEKIHELNEKIQERYINPEYFNSDEKEQLNEKIQEKDFLDEKINEITFSFSLEDLVSINKMELKKYVNSDDFTPDKFQKSEVSDMRWLTLDECLSIIRPYNLEKLQVIKDINNVLDRYRLIS